jgi:hypothetical protein
MRFGPAIIPFAAFALTALVGCEDTAPKPAPVADTPKAAPGATEKGHSAPVSAPLKGPIKD